MRERVMNKAVEGAGVVEMVREQGAGLHPEVLWWTAFLIRTGAAPPGPAGGTASACEPRSREADGGRCNANRLSCSTHARVSFLSLSLSLFL